jgi:quercetin dioxygenase-like cupin family protein
MRENSITTMITIISARRRAGITRWAGMILMSFATVAAAQVPLSEEPRHRVVYETDRYRVLYVNIPPGDTSLDHVHDRDLATVALTDRADTRTQSPGQPWSAIRPQRPIGDVSVAEYAGNAGRHLIQTVGDVPYQLLAIENRRQGNWSAGVPLSAVGTTLTEETRAFRTYDVRLEPDLTQIRHVHTEPTIVVLIDGRVMSAGEERKEGDTAPAGLKQLVQTGEWVLVPAGESHHLVRLGVDDARVVEIEVR